MNIISTLFLSALFIIGTVSPGFAESWRISRSIDSSRYPPGAAEKSVQHPPKAVKKNERSTMRNERKTQGIPSQKKEHSSNHAVRTSKHSDPSVKKNSTFIQSNRHSVKSGGHKSSKAFSTKQGDRTVKRAVKTIRHDDRSIKREYRSINQDSRSNKGRERTTANVFSMKKNDYRVKSAVYTAKHKDRPVKKEPHFNKRYVPSSKRGAPPTSCYDSHHDKSGKQKDPSKHTSCSAGHPKDCDHVENHYYHTSSYHNYIDYIDFDPGYASGAVADAYSSCVVSTPIQKVVVYESLIVEQPYYVNEIHDDHVMVTASLLNVRSGPGMDFPVINQAYQGETLLVVGWNVYADWFYVELPSGEVGWVLAEYTASILPQVCG